MTIAPRTATWSSGLSTNDFAACLSSGLQPLGFVQGCSVVNWSFYGIGYNAMGFGLGGSGPSGYFEQYLCPHGMVSAEHRRYGMNYQKSWIEESYLTALGSATKRLLEEAKQLGAHGVIGVVDQSSFHSETSAFEISLSGTAVAIEGAVAPAVPFTTFLAGQKLNKLVEAGFAPVEILIGITAIGVMASCITEYQLSGGGFSLAAGGGWGGTPGGEIDQVVEAQTAARSIVRQRVRDRLGGDILHGASLIVRSNESQEGPQIEATLRGNRVRHFKEFAQIEPPSPVVHLSDR